MNLIIKIRNKPILFILFIGLYVLGAACSPNDSKTSQQESESDAEFVSKCLILYQNNFSELLTEQKILNATGFSKQVLEIDCAREVKHPLWASCLYHFENKKKVTFWF